MAKIYKTVLLIEDEAAMRKVLKNTLESEGLYVLEAKDGKIGLEKSLLHHPDLIVLDIIMPHKNGIRVLSDLRQDEWGKSVPVLILTNVNDTPAVINALEFENNAITIESDPVLTPKLVRTYVKKYLNNRLEHGVYDFLIKSDCTLEDIVSKIKKKLQCK